KRWSSLPDVRCKSVVSPSLVASSHGSHPFERISRVTARVVRQPPPSRDYFQQFTLNDNGLCLPCGVDSRPPSGGYPLFLTPPSLGGDRPPALRPARNPPRHCRWRTACEAGRCTTNAANDAAAGAACTGVPTRSPPGQPSTATGGGASGLCRPGTLSRDTAPHGPHLAGPPQARPCGSSLERIASAHVFPMRSGTKRCATVAGTTLAKALRRTTPWSLRTLPFALAQSGTGSRRFSAPGRPAWRRGEHACGPRRAPPAAPFWAATPPG